MLAFGAFVVISSGSVYADAQGRTLDDIVGEMKMVAEGVKSTQAVLELARVLGMPVNASVTEVAAVVAQVREHREREPLRHVELESFGTPGEEKRRAHDGDPEERAEQALAHRMDLHLPVDVSPTGNDASVLHDEDRRAWPPA